MRILFIHGRAQENFEQEELKETWSNALALSFADAGLPQLKGLSIDFVYYAKELVAQKDAYVEAIRNGSYVFRGENSIDKLQSFEDDFIFDIAENAKIDKRKAQDEFGEETAQRGLGNNSVATYLLRAIDKNFPSASNYSVRELTPDVAAYLIIPNVREAINNKIIDTLTLEPTIIIAHSLGTIIAYNVLQAIENKGYDIKMLITLGSPLGVKSVQRQILGRLRYPRTLNGPWYNIYDPLDIVALNPLDEDNFNTIPKIVNFVVANLSDNRHNITHYLSAKEVARVLNDFLNDQEGQSQT